MTNDSNVKKPLPASTSLIFAMIWLCITVPIAGLAIGSWSIIQLCVFSALAGFVLLGGAGQFISSPGLKHVSFWCAGFMILGLLLLRYF